MTIFEGDAKEKGMLRDTTALRQAVTFCGSQTRKT